jgi:N-acetylglutamate synthase-like GNAT family acetyltransferase
MHVDHLADHPQLIPQLAALHFEQWGYLRPDETLEQRTRRLEAACGRDAIPSVFAALDDNGALLGSAMLVARDMDTRPELTPWLAGVYVVADSRGRGLATALVRRVEQEAAALQVERLYLYTPSAEDFYVRLGWTLIERADYLGQQVAIMSKKLAPAPRP